MKPFATSLLIILGFTGTYLPLDAARIHWFAQPHSLDLQYDGQQIDESFTFELGVFRDGFVPDESNRDQWSDYWEGAHRIYYNQENRWFSGRYRVTDNREPFTAGTPAYIWGFQGDGESGQWILLGDSYWTWPTASPMDPRQRNWRAIDADTVLAGYIGESGDDFDLLMERVRNALPPRTSWSQWKGRHLQGEQSARPENDSFRAGTPNYLAFAFGLPREGTRPVGLQTQIVQQDQKPHLRIHVPRRADHDANLVLEGSTDLVNWEDLSGLLKIVSEEAYEKVYQMTQPLQPDAPRFFVRARAIVPEE
ncbi:MAG: hypothetical protein JJT75_08750 [Opitutales bacterium]|nr:hypothetical protein [Opitutales bacterium]MCH8541705.1 hypothetical protein [Opitutales bacterium]